MHDCRNFLTPIEIITRYYMNKLFTIRVYGILINDQKEVLISDERLDGKEFTKFPGGGLEYGEGLLEALIREFQEECGADVNIIRHVHTSERFARSAFNGNQVVAVHYEVATESKLSGRFTVRPFDFVTPDKDEQAFRWVPIAEFNLNELTFDLDKDAWLRFLELQHVS